jgi:hypothetical protein
MLWKPVTVMTLTMEPNMKFSSLLGTFHILDSSLCSRPILQFLFCLLWNHQPRSVQYFLMHFFFILDLQGLWRVWISDTMQSAEVHRHFKEVYYFHIQGQNIVHVFLIAWIHSEINRYMFYPKVHKLRQKAG